MAIVLITPPAIEPVTLADLKLQCGLPPGDDGDHVKTDMVHRQLRRFIRLGRAMCENYTRRVFITQTWKQLLDGWPTSSQRYNWETYPSIVLAKPPFQSIVSFTYIDTTGTAQDMTAYGFQIDPGSETQSARLTPPYAQPWPPIRMVPNNVVVTYKCGYGDAASSVPEPILDAILFAAQFFYDGNPLTAPLPKIVTDLLDPYRNLVS